MTQHGLDPDYSAAAMHELASIRGPAITDDASMQDLTGLPWCSIDNTESRDLDQLTVVREISGTTRLLVAIADVDAVVKAGSAVDAHAQGNTTSVYTPAQVFSMLPEKLSTDLTSLAFDSVRLAVVVDLAVDVDGVIQDAVIYGARVRNRAKLAYDSVAAWLEGQGAVPEGMDAVPGLDANLRAQDAIAGAMRGRRHRCGALSLQTPEARVLLSGDVVTDVQRDEPNRAKALIEDVMIGANVATAQYLERKGYPSIRRVLRTPKRWERIVDIARELGDTLPSQPDGVALEQFLERRRAADPARFADLSVSIVKLLGSGEYALSTPGQRSTEHFGLAASDYTHSTAPNRRFADLVTQRILKAALVGAPSPYDPAALVQIAQHCTLQEDNAEKVERQVRKSAAALLLQSRIGQRFEGFVTGASAKGTWVRIDTPAVEGRVVRGFEGLDVGERVAVELLATNVEQGYIDFARVGPSGSPNRKV